MKTKKLLATLAIVSVVLITGCKKDEYKGLPLGKCPAVDRTIPTNDAHNVPLKQIISATFNKKGMNPETITKTSFTIQQGATAIAGTKSAMVEIGGTVTYNDGDSTTTFKPDIDLIPYTIYEGRIKSSVKDLLGNALKTDYVWHFTTIPQVTVSSNPIAGGSAIIMDNLREGTFDEGSSVTVTATPNPGYAFTNWTDTDKGTIASTSSSYTFPLNTNTNLVANFANTYTLTIIATNGDVVKTPDLATYNQGTTVTLTATPHLGYTFTNWTGDASGFLNPLPVTMDKNKIITANFTINVYALNITAPNGTFTKTPDQATYNHGTVVPLTATANPGYTFVNWTEDGNVISTVPDFSVTMTGTRTLVANFAINAYALHITAPNGTFTKTPDQATYNHGTVVPLTATANPGYHFVNWTEDGNVISTKPDFSVTMTGPKTLVANFAKDALAPTVNSTSPGNGDKCVVLDKTVTAIFSEPMDPSNPKTSFTLKQTLTSTPVDGEVTYSGTTASFNPKANLLPSTQYTATITTGAKSLAGIPLAADKVWTFSTGCDHFIFLSAEPVAGGTTDGAGSYSAGASVTVTASKNTGYNFVNWTDKLNGTEVSTNSNYQFIMPANNRSLVANFTAVLPNTFTLTVNATNGDVVKIPDLATYNSGATVTLTATPHLGYTFTNWTGDASGIINTTTVTMNSDKVITANFTAILPNTFTLIVTAVNGSVLQNPFKVAYNSGDIVTLTATPNIDYAFSSWSGDATGSSSTTTVTMNSDKNVTANFIVKLPATFTLNVTTVNGTVTKAPDLVFYPSGSNVILTPSANPGYKFDSWGGDASGNADPLTVIMNSDKNITANFTLIPIVPIGPGVVDLGSAGDFAILTKTGITTTGVTSITGDIGVSPAAATYIRGFGLIMDSSNEFSKSDPSTLVSGKVYASDYSPPTPTKMTTAVSDMETAYTTAMGLTTPAPIVEQGAGDISGLTLAPGLYKWGTGVLITGAGVTLSGGANDTWVFQIAQDLTVNSSAIVTLIGGAQAKNIVWVVAGQATLGTDADFSGIILSQTLISLNARAKVTGRLLAQSEVTLIADTVTEP